MRRERGFTLIELAIVLVIIGIIIGMVLKGQDLIQNARMKSFVNKVRQWESYVWIYLDRKGRFPGDSDRNGKIGDGNVCYDIANAGFANPPYEGVAYTDFDCTTTKPGGNTITYGSNTFYVFFGTDGGADAGKNIMVICASSDCTVDLTPEQIAFIESLDTSVDGVANGSVGQIICTNTTPDSITLEEWEASYNSPPTSGACSIYGGTKAAVYYFDAKR